MISLIYSAGLRRSELLNLTPQDIMSERMLIRIMGKGKNAATSRCRSRYCANFGNISRNTVQKKMLFEGETPGEQYSSSALVKVLKLKLPDRSRHQAPGIRTHATPFTISTRC